MVSTKVNPPKVLSNEELAELRKGEEVKIYVTNSKIVPYPVLLGSLPKKLMSHFSPLWKRRLEARDFSEWTLSNKFIIEWMEAGGTDNFAEGCHAFPENNIEKLLMLNRVASKLGIDVLIERTLERIDIITQSHTLTLEAIENNFETHGLPSKTCVLLGDNLRKWVQSLTKDEWAKKVWEAEDLSILSLVSLGMLRGDSAAETINYSGAGVADVENIGDTQEA